MRLDWGMLALFMACGTDVQVAPQEQAQSAQDRLGLTDSEVRSILDFLNDCAADFDTLDVAVGLDSDTATNVVEHRDGPDAECGSRDDDPFDSLDELDEVPQVGDQSILDVLSYVSGGASGAGTWEGVTFTAEEQDAALDIANHATATQLDDGAGLPSDAATNIVDARPIDSMTELAEVPQVGESALQKIRDYISTWEGR